jgi:hypothetical protein
MGEKTNQFGNPALSLPVWQPCFPLAGRESGKGISLNESFL